MLGNGKMGNGMGRALTPRTMASNISAHGKMTNGMAKAHGSLPTAKNMSGNGATMSKPVVVQWSSLTANSIAWSGKRDRLGRLAGNRYRLGEELSMLPEEECSMLRRRVCPA